MKTLKQFLAVALSILLLAAALPLPAFAEEPPMEGECGENATWWVVKTGDVLVSNETGVPVADPEQADPDETHYENRYALVIEGSGAMTDFVFDFGNPENSVLPPWDEYSAAISQIEVCEGITHIGDNAFRWLGNLKTVSLPEGLLSIGAFAFESCKFGFGEGDAWTPVYGLEEITIPASVTYIAGQAFAHNDYLATVNFTGDLTAVCLAGEEETADWNPWDRVREVFDGSPWYDTWFWENYFSGACGETATWRLEENEDGYWAYDGPANTPVEDPADYNAENTHWEARYTLYVEGEGAMADCNYEEGERVPQPWEPMRWAVTEVNVSDGITRVGNSAFRWFDHLRTVSLPESLTSIGEFAFERCVSGWGDENGWYADSGLAGISIPAGVTYIGRQAFAHNDFLVAVNFEGDLEEVCLAGDEFAADWNPAERVREVFDGTPWYDQWVRDNFMQGDCGESATWQIVENEDGYWAWNDEAGTPVEDPDDYNTDNTHFETRYTLYINGAGAMDDYNYDEWNGDIVRQPWEPLQREISRVTVAEGITSVGGSAFREFNRLAVVELPESLTGIGARAFENCRNGWGDENGWQAYSGLEEITIPAGVAYVGSRAFGDDRFLQTVNFEGDLAAVCLAGEDYAEGWNPADRVREVFDGTPWYAQWIEDNFMSGDCGENATFAIEVNEDGYWAWNDEAGTPVEDPDDYNTDNTHWEPRYTLYINGTGAMDDYNYDEWSGDIVRQPWEPLQREISRVVVAEGITGIGDYAFFEFNRLAVAELPESLTDIGAGAFQNCRHGWGDENGWQAYSGLEEITIPAGVSHLGSRAFADDRFLSTVNYEGDIEAICLAGDDFAEGWTGMERVFSVFNDTPWLEAFIQENYLHGECGEGLTWRLVDNEDGVFVYNETGEIVPDPDSENEEDIHFERRLTLIIEGTGAMDDYVFDFDNYENCVFPPWNFFSNMITRIEVCEGVTHVGDNAFRWHDQLKLVSLPDTLLSIGAFAFENCMHGVGEDEEWTPVYGLAEVTIPKNVTYIGEEAFANNNFLTKVDAKCDLEAVCLAGDDFWSDIHPVGRVLDVFHDTPWLDQWIEENYKRGTCGENITWKLEETGEGIWVYAETGELVEDPGQYGTDGTFYAEFYDLVITGEGEMFDYTDGIPALDYYGISVNRITVGEGVTDIGENAFVNCPEIRSVSLPLSLTRVGENAFSACVHLETVNYAYPGDAEDWAAITIADGNDPLLQAELRLHTHTPGAAVTENEVPATCEGAGSYDSVVYCTDCGRELSRDTVPTDPLGHDFGPVTYVWAEDCSYCTAKRVCRRDASHVGEEKSDPSTAERTEPGCTEDGKIVYTAFFANESLDTQVKTVVLPKLGHNYQPTVTAPTCTDQGYTTYLCSRCADSYIADETPAKGHTPGQAVKENEVPATCEGAGSYDTVVYCTVCGAELSRAATATDPLGHDYVDHAAKAPTCAEPGWDAYKTCSRCDYTSYAEIPATGRHSWDGGTVTKEPTASEPGVRTFTCTVCKGTKTEEIPKLNVPAIDGEKAKEQGNKVFAAEGLTADELLKLAGDGASLTKGDTAVKPDQAVGTGMVLTKADGTKVTVVVKGDNDGDGKVTTNDARNALRASIGLDHPNEWQTAASLVVSKDEIRTADARGILRAAIGLDQLALV